MKRNLLVYPFDNNFQAVLRHSGLLCEYNISGLVSPNGWGLLEKDAGEAGKADEIGIKVSGNFIKELEECDTVLFVDSQLKLDINKLVYPKMLEAIKRRKNIICALDMDSQTREELAGMASTSGVGCEFLIGTVIWQSPVKNEIYNINTPVVFVVGIAERTNKFELQLALREHFLDEGYRVSQIGTKRYCELLGFHSMPEFMYDPGFPESDRITLFNHYVKSMEKTEKPDVIIIGLSGGTMKFNNQFTNHFGISAYEISQAVTPDAAVCSVLYEEYKPLFFESVIKSLRYKLGFEVDCFNISNYRFDWIRTDRNNEMCFTLLNSDEVTQKIKEWSGLEPPVYNILNNNHADEMCKLMLNKLSSYAEVQAF